MEPRTPGITTREELKKNATREEFKNLITQDWRGTDEDWKKKRAWVANP